MIRIFTSKTQKVGERGEKIAMQFLQKHGFTIIEQNYSARYGEIDIVAQNGDMLYLVEVKSQNINTTINPFENLTPKKIRSLTVMTQIYIEHKKWEGDYRLIGCLVRLDDINRRALVETIDLA